MSAAASAFIPYLILGTMLLTDLRVKSWATHHLVDPPLRAFILGLMSFTYTLNTGMAWGLLREKTLPLSAGAVGNALDGLTRGASLITFLRHSLTVPVGRSVVSPSRFLIWRMSW